MRKNATKLAAAVLSLAMVMTSVSMPASAAKKKTTKINKSTATLYTNGSKSQKSTTLYVTVGGKKVKATFKSSNTKILTVAKKTGKVTAKKPGKATVTATYKKKNYKCKVTVKAYATSVKVSPTTVSLVKGKTKVVKATVSPSNASNKKVSFKSSNKAVATVSSTGKITAKKAGTAKITVTALGSKKAAKKAYVTVKVTNPAPAATETPVVTETPAATETPVATVTPSAVATEGTITITTNVTGASVTVMDGATVVTTGSTLTDKSFSTGKIKNGTYVVTVSKEGYKEYTQNVIVNGDDVKVDVKLESVNEVKATLKNAYKVNDTKVQVNFTNKIAVPTKDNFAIAGLTISAAELTEDQKSVILTVSGMELDKTYTVATKNIVDANGKAVADGTTDFVARKITYMAKMEIVDVKTGASRTELKSDGQDSAKVIVTLTDDAGNVIKDNAEITFTTTAGNFAENKVAVQSGIATNLFTTEISATKKDAYLTATVTSSANKDLLNTTINRTISMNPTINNDKNQSVGVSLTDVMVETCDRVILYFNKDVNATDYTYNDEEHGKYAYNADKMSVKIKDNAKTATSIDDNDTSLIKPIALVPVKGETKALCAILDTDSASNYLTDNSKLLVKVEDKTKSIKTPETKAAYVTDIRTPSMLNVTNEGLKTIKVTFSEPVQNDNNNAGSYSAQVLSKWVIDNTNLEDDKYGFNKSAKATVGTFNVKTGEDNRNVVTITLGKNADNKQIYFKAGSHSVQGNKIGDWANVTDTKNNLINTQTLDFVIEADEKAPTATVKVESPEQFDVKFNTLVNINDVKTNLELQQYKNGAWVKLDKINVRAIGVKLEDTEASEFIVELNEDWTKVLSTYTSKENYYNYNFRLHLEKEKVVNELNGLKNVELNLDLNDSIMKEPDVTSPKMTGVKQDGNTAVVIDMSEPVQIPSIMNPITPSSEQTSGLSTPIVQFISSDNKKTIKGNITAISDHHNQITVKPAEDMTAGTWKVVVRNISDDVGNTAETLVKNDFVVTGTIVAESGFKALWVVAVPAAKHASDPIAKSHNTGAEDIIYVKFNKQIKTYGGAANAGATTNYTVNGYTVPSTSKIDSSVEGYNAVANRKNNYNDLVAIHLPSGTLTGNSHTINISQTIESATGAKLENGGVKLLSENDNIFTWGYVNYSKTETKKVSELQALFDDGSYAKYDLTNVTFNGTDTSAKSFKLTHTSEVNFAGKTIKELTIDTKETGTLTVKDVTAEKITINAPNADVKLVNVNSTTTEVVDILDGTLTIDGGTIGNLKITDANAGAVELTNGANITAMEIDTTGNITLEIATGVTLPANIAVKKVCTLNIESGVNVGLELDASIKVDDMKILSTGEGPVSAKVKDKDKDDVTVPVKKNVVVTTPTKTATNTSFSVNAGKVDGAAKAGVIEVTVSVATGSATVTTKASIEVKNSDSSEDIAKNIRTELDKIIQAETKPLVDTNKSLKDAIKLESGSDNTVVIALTNNSIATVVPDVTVKYTSAIK